VLRKNSRRQFELTHAARLQTILVMKAAENLARCRARRLKRDMGLSDAVRGRAWTTHSQPNAEWPRDFGGGAPKIREKLRQQFTGAHLPAISTVHAVLDRHNLVKHRRRDCTPRRAPSSTA